jgi:hypothetical protein
LSITWGDTRRDTTGDTLAGEVGLVGELLRQVDLGNHVRDVHGRGEDLEALGDRRRRHDIGRRRRFLGWRRLVFLDLDEVDLLHDFFCHRFTHLLRRDHREADHDGMCDDREDGRAQRPGLLRL